MQALDFWEEVTVDKADLLENLVSLLADRGIRYCVVGGVAVNAYCEPVVTLDLAIAAEQIEPVVSILAERFQVTPFAHSVNVTAADSDLRVQIQTDPEYFEFPKRALIREVLGLKLPVAAIEDVLQGKVWAAQDPERRASKRLKDLADIQRLIESYPELLGRVPLEIQQRLVVPG